MLSKPASRLALATLAIRTSAYVRLAGSSSSYSACFNQLRFAGPRSWQIFSMSLLYTFLRTEAGLLKPRTLDGNVGSDVDGLILARQAARSGRFECQQWVSFSPSPTACDLRSSARGRLPPLYFGMPLDCRRELSVSVARRAAVQTPRSLPAGLSRSRGQASGRPGSA